MDLIINGTSLSSLGVIVENQTRFIKPKKRVDIIQIEGQDGAKVIEKGYEPYTLEYKITLTDSSNFNQIYALLNGDVVLQASDDPGNYWNAKVIENIDYDPLAIWKKAIINFFIEDPYRYKLDDSPTILVIHGNVINVGTVNSLPLIKITGSGTVVISIEERSFTYIFDTPYVYIDSFLQEAYHTSTLKNRKMTGEFPYLTPGVNSISWTGAVTEIEIIPRSRYL